MRKRAIDSTPLTATPLKVISAPPAKAIAPQIREVIEALGEDVNRQGLVRTPERVEKALRFLTSGYSADIGKIVNGAIYEVKYDEMVIVKDIEFFSMCEHHMLPFYGKVHVAYIARNKVIGLSKLPRIIDAFARRLQIQERLRRRSRSAFRICSTRWAWA
jgi:GTP cyclohydrolase I